MRFINEYAFLSNMQKLRVPIIYKDISYWSVENFYQAMKTLDSEERLMISRLNPYQSKKIGRKITMREDWIDIKLQVMKYAIDKKFNDDMLKTMLLNIDSDIIEDNYWNDTFWGVCKGRGLNMLGQILMEKRSRLS